MKTYNNGDTLVGLNVIKSLLAWQPMFAVHGSKATTDPAQAMTTKLAHLDTEDPLPLIFLTTDDAARLVGQPLDKALGILQDILGVLGKRVTTTDELARALWAVFGDTPIGECGDSITTPFLHFPVGTDRFIIWHWFEDVFDVWVVSLMMGEAWEISVPKGEE